MKKRKFKTLKILASKKKKKKILSWMVFCEAQFHVFLIWKKLLCKDASLSILIAANKTVPPVHISTILVITISNPFKMWLSINSESLEAGDRIKDRYCQL